MERQERVYHPNPYDNATIVDKVKSTKKIFFFDIDATLSGDPVTAQMVRYLVEKQGVPVVFVTSRTMEMTMDKTEYEHSVRLGLRRPEGKLGTLDGKKVIEDPANLLEFQGLLNPDLVAGTTGTEIAIRQKNGGYLEDREYHNTMRLESAVWRHQVMNLISEIDKTGLKLMGLAPIEIAQNYHDGVTDVYPPDYRIQVNFQSEKASNATQSTGNTSGGETVDETDRKSAFEAKKLFVQKLTAAKTQAKRNPTKISSNIRITDDSNPEKGRYSVYLTPNRGYKARAVEHVISQSTKASGVRRDELETVFFGDSFPDVAMGLYAGLGTKATFVPAGDTRLRPVFTDPNTTDFAGIGFNAIKKRLGQDTFRTPLFGERNVVIGKPTDPGPKTILTYLQTLEKNVS